MKTPSLDTPARNLSGGNIQKLILARELSAQPRVLLAAQPTRGVDVGAAAYIHERLIEQRNAGTAILVVSEDLDEILSLSDRILVMYEGEVISEVEPGDEHARGARIDDGRRARDRLSSIHRTSSAAARSRTPSARREFATLASGRRRRRCLLAHAPLLRAGERERFRPRRRAGRRVPVDDIEVPDDGMPPHDDVLRSQSVGGLVVTRRREQRPGGRCADPPERRRRPARLRNRLRAGGQVGTREHELSRIPSCHSPCRRDDEEAGSCEGGAPKELSSGQQVHDPEMGTFFGSSFPLTCRDVVPVKEPFFRFFETTTRFSSGERFGLPATLMPTAWFV